MASSISNPCQPDRLTRSYFRTCRALGLDHRVMDDDESPTRVTVWSVHELAGVRARVGGAVSTRPTPGDPQAETVTLTVDLPDIGLVTVESEALLDRERDVEVLAGMLARRAVAVAAKAVAS